MGEANQMQRHEMRKTVKLERKCPRCRSHAYHFGVRDMRQRVGSNCLDGVHHVTISCAVCSHEWRGRFVRDEWT